MNDCGHSNVIDLEAERRRREERPLSQDKEDPLPLGDIARIVVDRARRAMAAKRNAEASR
ncbi:hypothetical protein [Chelatococcus sp. YT9]|uniref:hypothetical protein n=1 Tax=Chelatococcus sp. YT9 TaxID=2835635 RepID=UPI001BD0A692|nr:hypothetical protein [Chelatococcus sp. YT9]MBS7698592.1 hypothetical protein [Chelatococcus sp. YT9]